MIGLCREEVKLLPYDPAWAELFREERELLLGVIGCIVSDVRHVGSTSVPGLCAKPILDIAAGVTALDDGLRCIGPLSRIGYEYRGDAGVPGRHFFAKGDPDRRTHYLHVEVIGGPLWENHVLFRDYLRTHGDALGEYAQLKRALAQAHPNDRAAYTDGKEAFIREILRLARMERSGSSAQP